MNGSGPKQVSIIRLHIHVPAHEALYDLETLARLAGVHPALVSEYVHLGLLDPVDGRDEQAWRFDDTSLHVFRQIQRLRSDLGVNINGVAVVLELLRQIDELHQELSRHRDE
jgi:MerR family transcriptional regulator/heat shock protein HspR